MMGDRPMRGMVKVPGPDVASEPRLVAWIDEAVALAVAEPPKKPKKKA